MKMLLGAVLFLWSTMLAADVRVPLDRHPSREWIGASLIDDDGSGIIALKNGSAFSTRMLHFDSAGRVRTVTIADLAVNHMKKLDDGTLFVGGARRLGDEALYERRIVRLRNGRYETVWEASSLPREHYSPDHTLQVSNDGRYWAAAVTRRSGYRLAISETSNAKPPVTYDMTVSSAGGIRTGIVNDGFGVEFAGAPSVGVLWSGRVHLFSGIANEAPVLLVPEGGGSFLSFDSRTGTLWVHTTNGRSAFDTSRFATAEKTRGMKPSKVAPTEAAPSRQGTFAASPSGAALLLLPDGPGSDVAIIRLNR